MKQKIAAFLLAMAMATTSVMPVFAEERIPTADDTEVTTGEWVDTTSPVLTDELTALFEKAISELTGKNYIPVAHLATQIVDGTNHMFLCREADVAPEVKEVYCLMVIYESPDKSKVSVQEIKASKVETGITDMEGGIQQAKSPEVTPELLEIFQKPYELIDGVQRTPLALVSTQLVNGMNYRFLVKKAPVVPDPEVDYCFITIHKDIEGNVSEVDCISMWDSPELNSNEVTLKRGKKFQLEVINTDQAVKWSTNNKKVATVSKTGKVKAKKKGSAIITATLEDGTALICNVNVTK